MKHTPGPTVVNSVGSEALPLPTTVDTLVGVPCSPADVDTVVDVDLGRVGHRCRAVGGVATSGGEVPDLGLSFCSVVGVPISVVSRLTATQLRSAHGRCRHGHAG
jgi:hypothetical protein